MEDAASSSEETGTSQSKAGSSPAEQKSEGYGIARVDYDDAEFVIECWPWSASSAAEDDEQFPGWPYRLPFGRRTAEGLNNDGRLRV